MTLTDPYHQHQEKPANTSKKWARRHFSPTPRARAMRGPDPMVVRLFLAVIALILIFILWASLAEVDEVTRGEGQVIPAGKVQVLQNLEGGVVERIHVSQGDIVAAGEVLLEIDSTGFASSLAERKIRLNTLEARIIRLEAQISGADSVDFPAELATAYPDIVSAERELFQTRMAELNAAASALKNEIEQRQEELKEYRASRSQLQKNLDLARQEYDMAKPLEQQGAISQMELVRLERELNDIKRDMVSAESSIPQAKAALAEAQDKLEEARLKFANEARLELGEAKEEAARLREVLKSDADKVQRTRVRAPVRAEVKQVLVNTVGGVVQPGMDLVELVPLDDSLLIEAKIKPQDIAFIRPGQPAKVRITAYDFAIYGGLDGKVERISPDTIFDEVAKQYFYKILVRTNDNSLQRNGQTLPIMTGMVATVDIITGKRTIMNYLLKPINRAQTRAFSER